ncbi:MAG: YDG domain-containing protein, partial [Rubrivivax sp.]|nr:YDG domain-containing protein [Rubrivivax sp.]
KVYDGNIGASVTATSTDILAIDIGSLGFSASGLFTGGKNVGTGKLVDVSGAFLTGAARDNYAISNTSGSTTANITPRTVTANYTGGSKVYDGTVSAAVTGSLSNRVSGDALTTTQTAEFTGAGARNVGTGKAISVTDIVLAGADAGNYVLANTTDTTTGNITPKPITISGLGGVLATDRVYDGTRVVSVTVPGGVTLVPDSSDIVAGDTVSIAVPPSGVTTGTMANKNVGAGKVVTVDGLTLSGTDAANYSIAGTAGITVSITPKLLTAVYSGVNKVYDGSTAVNATGTSADIISGDTVLIRGNGNFTGTDAKNVGTAKPVAITSASLSSTDAANYSLLNTTGSTTADVTPRLITPTYSGGSRVYDGSVAAPVTASVSGFVTGDSVLLFETAVFSGAGARNAGTGKPITITGIGLGGSDAANYSLTTTGASTTGSITPKPLTLIGLTGVTASDRVYDGTLSVSVNISGSGTIGIDTADIVAGDDVGIVAPAVGTTTGTLLNKNVGSNKPLTVDGLGLTGTDAGNYTVTAASGLTVNITPKPLSASYTGVNKVYDGTSAASVLGSSADIVAGDSVSISGTGVFSTGKNVGSGLAITVTAGSMSGSDAGNYLLLTTTGSTTADITPLTVLASFLGGTRVYDGTAAAPVTGTLTGLITGDTVALSQTATFAGAGAKNVGSNKTVDVTGISLSGTDAANYSLLLVTATTTASVTPRPLGIIGLSG